MLNDAFKYICICGHHAASHNVPKTECLFCLCTSFIAEDNTNIQKGVLTAFEKEVRKNASR